MDGFYALAVEDYRRLEAARDWAADLRARADPAGRVRLLDVACGSGKFPAALLGAGLAERARGVSVSVDLLDPSPFSLAEARGALAPPFAGARDLQTGIEELAPPAEPYDVAWATHALYAVPPALLGEALRRMDAALRSGGLGAIGHATSRSHYLRVY
jgi:SAM-dependent methyltransferase